MNNRVVPHKETRSHRFLVILFGMFEYDGRVQRTIEVLASLGSVTLVDVRPSGSQPAPEIDGVEHISVESVAGKGKIFRHLRLWFAALRVARRIRPDIVVASNFFTMLPGWMIARILRARLVYDAYELIIPESGVPMSRRDRFWYGLERWVVPRADLVIAANEERAIRMREHYALPRVPEFVRNIPPRRGGTGENARKRSEIYYGFLRRGEERIVLYQGDMSLERGIGRFLESIVYLPETFRLVLVGGGADEQNIAMLANRLGIGERVTQLGLIPSRELPGVSRMCDIGIVTYPLSGLNNIYCSPNKIFEYAQAGLPVVATDQPPLKSMVERYDIGRCVGATDSPEVIAETIVGICAHEKADYAPALAAFLSDHRWENEAERLQVKIKSMFL